LVFAGCATTAGPPARVTYVLSSPDKAVAWHLHGRDGALLCELPCSHALPADSGAWLGVHDPKKSWRVNVPDDLPAAPGSRVFATVHVGKGTPVLGTIGSIAAISGGTAAISGLVLLIASLAAFAQGCDAAAPTCSNFDMATTYGSIGATGLVVGTVLGVLGAYWMEHDRAPTLHVTPTGVAASF
jgi:hypothetical protein